MNTALAQLQALLFISGAPVPKKRLAAHMNCSGEKIEQLLKQFADLCEGSGVTLIDDGAQVTLATGPALAEFIERAQKEDRTIPLSKSSQETLAIIAYAGPIAKVDIDFLRGVNAQYAVRRLAMRGLIQEQKKEGGRKLFAVTTDFLAHLGLRSAGDLPDYETIRRSIQNGIRTTKEKMNE